MKKDKIIYWIATGLLSAQMIASATYYLIGYGTVKETFLSLGFPAWLVLPLAIAKYLGIIAILTKKSKALKQFAYAGFFYNFLLAIGAHVGVGDGQWPGAAVALVILAVSYYYDRKLFP